MKIIRSTYLLSICLVLNSSNFGTLYAQDQKPVTRSEYESLAARVSMLEARLGEVQMQQLEDITQTVLVTKSEADSSKTSLIENVVSAIKQREQEVNFPWMDDLKWSRLNNGMTPSEVIYYLGEPTLDEPSLNRRIDFVYTYQGRRPANNKKVEGKIRFYKGRVVEIEVPKL